MLVLYDFCCHLLGICIGFEILGENEFRDILRTPKNIPSLLLSRIYLKSIRGMIILAQSSLFM